MAITSKNIVDVDDNPPPSNATHYLNYTSPKDLYKPGDRVGFVKVANGIVHLLYPRGATRRDYRLHHIEELGYILHTLKTLEELMEEYLEK